MNTKQDYEGQNFSNFILSNTEVRTLFSPNVGQEFLIFVSLPRNYSNSTKTYPVLYVLDANGYFAMVTQIVRQLELDLNFPELIVVGIGYPVKYFIESFGYRGREVTPTKDDETYSEFLEGFSEARGLTIRFEGTGGAENFHEFICETLIPFTNKNYRADNNENTLVGYSASGLFATYSLLHPMRTFNRFLICSPSLWWNDKVIFRYEAEFAAKHQVLESNVFFSAGSLEELIDDPDPFNMISNLQQLVDILRGRKYEGLNINSYIFDDETHLSVVPAAISRGLRTIFEQ